MSERLERITPEMSEEEALGLILDELVDRADSDVAEAIRLCAIPHWFNEEILAWLRGEGREPSKRTGVIMAELTKMTFVSPYHDRGYVLHKNVRDLLLDRWREDAESLQELSGVAAAYYADKLQAGESSGERGAEWKREEVYHLLVADEERGIERFISLIDKAGQSCRLSTFELLLNLARELEADLEAYNQPWLQFYEGKLALLSGDWEEALKIWESLQEGQMSADLEKTLAVHQSVLYKDKGNWDKAVERLQRSQEILKQMGDKRGRADILNSLSFLYKDREEWDEAVKHLQRSLEILKEMGDGQGKIDAFNYLGLLYKDKGEREKAAEYFHRGLDVLEHGRAAILKNLGFLYKDKGEWERADGYFQKSLEILKQVGDEREMADAFTDLGFLSADKKEWEKADGYFQRSLEILEKMGDERGRVDIFNHLGSLYRRKGEWEKADRHFRRGLKILEKMGDERGAATVFNNLGLLYKDKGERGEAAKYFGRGLEIVEKVGDEMNAATTMYNLASLYEDMEQYDEAVELLKKVVRISEQVGHPDLRIRKSREALERIKKNANFPKRRDA